MHRLIVSPESLQKPEVTLGEGAFHHLCRVLRLKAGDEVVLLNGHGGCGRCRILAVAKKSASLLVMERWQEEERVFPIRLIQGVPKAEKMDFILQKGTEVGVSVFSPVTTERSVPLLDGERHDRRLSRWHRIVEEATGQCRRSHVPEIHPVTELNGALNNGGEGLRLVCWEGNGVSLREVLPASAPVGAAVLIGPEGGFSEREIDQAQEAGFSPITLGPRILRTETAGLVISAWLQFLYGDMA